MARTQAGRDATEQHRRRQVDLANRVRREFARLWPAWTITDRRGFDRLVDVTLPLIEARQLASATEAARYLSAFAMVEGAAAPSIADRPEFDRDRAAASMYATGQSQASRALAAGMSAAAVRQQTLVTLTGSVVRHSLNGGRQLIEDTVVTETGGIQGWMRVTGPSPCAFCAMVAARGPVYTSQDAASQVVGRMGKWDRKALGDSVLDPRRPIRERGNRQLGDPYHDHCVCTAEPFYEGSQMSPQSEQFAQMWDEAQANGTASGTSNDMLNNFRQLLDRRLTTAA